MENGFLVDNQSQFFTEFLEYGCYIHLEYSISCISSCSVARWNFSQKIGVKIFDWFSFECSIALLYKLFAWIIDVFLVPGYMLTTWTVHILAYIFSVLHQGTTMHFGKICVQQIFFHVIGTWNISHLIFRKFWRICRVIKWWRIIKNWWTTLWFHDIHFWSHHGLFSNTALTWRHISRSTNYSILLVQILVERVIMRRSWLFFLIDIYKKIFCRSLFLTELEINLFVFFSSGR